jgi:hypothetical protein
MFNNELEFRLRYTLHEGRTKIFRRTFSYRTDYPVFHLKYTYGIKYHYSRVEAGIQVDRFFRNFGRTSFSLQGGYINRHIPVMMLFSQSYLNRNIFFNEESKQKFNAIVNQMYAANQYISGFLYHDFGSLLHRTKSKVFSPRIALAQSAGWSKLSHPNDHGGAPLYDMHEGYFESGVVVEDIIRINYFNVFYAGLGFALYGSYGGCVKSRFEHTLTPMARLSISF